MTWKVKMEKLEVVGHLSRTEGGSVDPTGKIGHWSARSKITKEECEELEGAETDKQEKKMEVDEATLHEASTQVQSPKRKVIRVENQKRRKNYVRETLAISQADAEEMGFVPRALKEPQGPFTGVTIDAVKRPSNTGG